MWGYLGIDWELGDCFHVAHWMVEIVDAKGWWGSIFKARKKQKSAFSASVGVRGMPNPLHWGRSQMEPTLHIAVCLGVRVLTAGVGIEVAGNDQIVGITFAADSSGRDHSMLEIGEFICKWL